MKKIINLLTAIIPIVVLISLTTGCTKISLGSFFKSKTETNVYFHKGVYKSYSFNNNQYKNYFYIFYDENSGHTEESEKGIGLPFSCVQKNGSVKFKFGGVEEPEKILKIKSVKNKVITGSFEDGVLLIFVPISNGEQNNIDVIK